MYRFSNCPFGLTISPENCTPIVSQVLLKERLEFNFSEFRHFHVAHAIVSSYALKLESMESDKQFNLLEENEDSLMLVT